MKDLSETIEREFNPIVDAVQRFADQHELVLLKCPRGNAGWELVRPCEGGDITLLLLYNPTSGLGVGSVWQYGCVEMSKYYSHFRSINACPIEPDAVVTRLTEELNAIMEVRFGHWTDISDIG